MILRSQEDNAAKLKEFLSQSNRIDITNIFDRQGYTALSYAIFKERS